MDSILILRLYDMVDKKIEKKIHAIYVVVRLVYKRID